MDRGTRTPPSSESTHASGGMTLTRPGLDLVACTPCPILVRETPIFVHPRLADAAMSYPFLSHFGFYYFLLWVEGLSIEVPQTMSLVPSPLPFPFPFFLLHFFPFLSVRLFPLSCALALSSPLSLVPLLALSLSFSFSFSLFSVGLLPPPTSALFLFLTDST